MTLEPETERMADLDWQHAKDEIVEEFRQERLRLSNQWHTETGLNRELLKVVPATVKKLGDALIKSYLHAFELENKTPGPTDAAAIDRKIEVLFCGNFGLDLSTIDIRQIQETIKKLERQAQEKMQSRIRKMILTKNKVPQSGASYNLNVQGDFIGGAQVGPNNTQTIGRGIQHRNGKPHIRWSQLRPIIGDQRVSEIGDIQVTSENIREAEAIGGNPWIELHDATTFGTSVRKYVLGLFTPE